jgi:WD40 repeat protein
VNSSSPIFSLKYNQHSNEIVVGGLGLLACWAFRYGNRHIVLRGTSSDADLAPNYQIKLMAFEETNALSQQCFVSDGTSILTLSIHELKLVSSRTNMHVRPITALMFFNPLKYLCTASQDGSIKVWDSKTWSLLLVFVGHAGSVNSLSVYPFGPNIISASEDSTIRVWSLETCDEIDRIDVPEAVKCVGTEVKSPHLFSYVDNTFDLWRVEDIFQHLTFVGCSTWRIKALYCAPAGALRTTRPSRPTMRPRDFIASIFIDFHLFLLRCWARLKKRKRTRPTKTTTKQHQKQ